MDLVPARQQVRHRGRGRVVRDRRTDDVDHEPVIALHGDLERRLSVEAAAGGEMDVAAEDGDADGEVEREGLQTQDEGFALSFVQARGVVVVEVVEQVDFAVEVVEEAAGDAEALVEDLDGRHDWGGEEAFEPGEARVGDRDAQEEDEVLDSARGG